MYQSIHLFIDLWSMCSTHRNHLTELLLFLTKYLKTLITSIIRTLYTIPVMYAIHAPILCFLFTPEICYIQLEELTKKIVVKYSSPQFQWTTWHNCLRLLFSPGSSSLFLCCVVVWVPTLPDYIRISIVVPISRTDSAPYTCWLI